MDLILKLHNIKFFNNFLNDFFSFNTDCAYTKLENSVVVN